jgi:hypothetical protein
MLLLMLLRLLLRLPSLVVVVVMLLLRQLRAGLPMRMRYAATHAGPRAEPRARVAAH